MKKKLCIFISIFIAILSFATQMGYYWFNSKIQHSDVFSSLSSKDAFYYAVRNVETLRMDLWKAEEKNKPIDNIEENFLKAKHRKKVITDTGFFQTIVGFPYLFLLYFIFFPLILIMVYSGFQGKALIILDLFGIQHSHFENDPTFATYFKVACVSFVAYIGLGIFIGYAIPGIIRWFRKGINPSTKGPSTP